ncbi:MAG: dihydrolipoyl dehydrogenase [Bacilli bacterium]|nr:dihydrolipoyl dehydrogenase [Bacilli bacterium]
MKEFDIIIIGAGPGGYATALDARSRGFSVLLIEKEKLGGTCLNCGCIPTKAYNAIASLINHTKDASVMGLEMNYTLDFTKALEYKNNVVCDLTSGIDFMLKKAGVEVIYGKAALSKPNYVSVNSEEYYGKYIIIATGSRNLAGIIKGDDKALNSTDILALDSLPESLAIIGGGVIGVEIATIFALFGSKVTIFEAMDSLIPQADKEIARRLRSYLTKLGVTVNTNAKVLEIKDHSLVYSLKDEEKEESFEKIMMAIGHRPNIEEIGLETIGILYDKKGIIVNDYFETNLQNHFAIGDCNGKIMLAHYAEFSGKVVLDHIEKKYDDFVPLCPSAIFTIPEIAQIGLTEEELKEKGIEYTVKKTMYRSLGKALAMNEKEGFIKLLIVNNKIVGCHIIGYDASTLIHEAMLLMNLNVDSDRIKDFIYAHPTLSEIFK